MRRPLLLLLALSASFPAWAKKVDLDYQVRLLPQTGQAEVRLTLADAGRDALRRRVNMQVQVAIRP